MRGSDYDHIVGVIMAWSTQHRGLSGVWLDKVRSFGWILLDWSLPGPEWVKLGFRRFPIGPTSRWCIDVDDIISCRFERCTDSFHAGHFLRRHRFRHQAATALLPEGSLGLLPLQFSWSSHSTHCEHPRSPAVARETLPRPELLQGPHPFRHHAEAGHPDCHSYPNIHVDPCDGVDTLPEDTWHKCIGQRLSVQSR